MTDVFASRSAKPMLVAEIDEPFDSDDHVFELKMDGERCLAYLDDNETVLINRRGRYVLSQFPELAAIHKQVDSRILDGEIIIGVGAKEDFEHIKQRSVTKNPLAITRLSRVHPATFVAVDILYRDDALLTKHPLEERLDILHETVAESENLALSRVIPRSGIDFFDRVKKLGLEGIIAKRLDSPYRMGIRSTDWLKIKNWLQDDFIVCGYMIGERAAVASLILGQYGDDGLVYKGRVTLGLRRADFTRIRAQPRRPNHPFALPPPREVRAAVWLQPVLVV
ncbi:MAG: hypothetical protein LUG50_15160, partial [Planctomycetaceae bacterium]|nr:hypothetical protein [Planctomycetaceae bacterium]